MDKNMLTRVLSVSLNVHNLTALVHAGLQINVVWTAQFAGGLVLNPSHSLHFLARAAHADTATGHLFAWNSHIKPLKTLNEIITAESTDKSLGGL
jgi:hypothetical protein